MSIQIHGSADPAFAALAGEFERNFIERGDVGAALSLVIDGRAVVDLWAGSLDAAGQRPWRADSVVNVWSTTKAVGALCFAMLVDRGACAYDDKVARWWPEFAAHGKDGVTIAMLLSHQAGLCSFRDPAVVEDFYDLETAADRLAASEPLWPPGSRSGYHAISIGVLAGALFRRIEGRSLTDFVAAELSAPLGLDLTLGLPVSQDARRAEMIAPPELATSNMTTDLNPSQAAAYLNPVIEPLLPNTAAWRACELVSANGFSNARSLARLFGEVAAGRLLSPQTLAQATQLRISGVDEVLGVPARWGAGFLLNTDGLYGPAPATFGHSGWGGSFAIVDPARRAALAYTMNRMGTDLVGDPRDVALIAAAYEGLTTSA
ncbi:esterase [Phenylobacterium sp. Root77]|uniref:serine hydrolase domain-containing protein n=1 Tax=unclassified Phenylobacterium TaxID=2640670 RepID=UPI0006F8C96B|nr:MULTISPECIES: serine hydrolase domain-containing protein [unclassified Phenylobacterium]KQW69295.1 esterase [Phenylobacterium sp. Root1277]KQW95339.1 esterase [Phenylobacterium sp. Root1290]KRC41130.1 esterase [Phenylobacterium sp. Root77]